MKLNPDSYVPSLRWRMGEYQALFRLAKEAKDRVVPFVLVPEIEFDFEEWRPKKTVQEHVKPFAKRFKDKWGKRPAWIDVHPSIEASLMDDGKVVVAHVFDEMRKLGCMAVPVTSLDAPPEINAAVASIVKADQRGVGIRARLEHIMKPGYSASLATLIGTIGTLAADTDLIIDLGAPNYEPFPAPSTSRISPHHRYHGGNADHAMGVRLKTAGAIHKSCAAKPQGHRRKAERASAARLQSNLGRLATCRPTTINCSRNPSFSVRSHMGSAPSRNRRRKARAFLMA